MEEGKLSKWLKNEGDSVVRRRHASSPKSRPTRRPWRWRPSTRAPSAKLLIAAGTEGVKVNTPIAVLRGRRRQLPMPRPQKAPKAERRCRLPPRSPRPTRPRTAGSGCCQGADAGRPVDGRDRNGDDDGARPALRDAMAEEMRANDDVFIMGEEVAEYQGAYKITQGLLQEFGPPSRHRYADHRAWLCRRRRRCGDGRTAADRRVHDLQLRHAGDRPDHQLGGQDPLHVGRPDGRPHRVSRSATGLPPASARSTARIMRPGTARSPASRSSSPTRRPMPRVS